MTRLRKQRVLIVEDDYYLATDAARILDFVGADVIGPVACKQDAIIAITRDEPSCALVDINLGEGADFSLADHLVKRGIMFLFFTGYDHEAIPARFADVIRLQKPVRAGRLTSALEKLASDRTGCR